VKARQQGGEKGIPRTQGGGNPNSTRSKKRDWFHDQSAQACLRKAGLGDHREKREGEQTTLISGRGSISSTRCEKAKGCVWGNLSV